MLDYKNRVLLKNGYLRKNPHSTEWWLKEPWNNHIKELNEAGN